MKLHGSIENNVEGAIASVRRHKGRSVYPQTVAHWHDLLAHAWWTIGSSPSPNAGRITQLAKLLEAELAARGDAA